MVEGAPEGFGSRYSVEEFPMGPLVWALTVFEEI